MRPQRTTLNCAMCNTVFTVHAYRADRAKFCSLRCSGRSHHFQSLEERFWAKVERGDDCWPWTGSRTHNGYGTILVIDPETRQHRMERAHRASWRLHFGPIPDGMQVLHRCDVRACIRPDHLFLGTAADNTADMIAKGRMPVGQRAANAKLTEDDVRRIRALAGAGRTYVSIAAEFGVGDRAVARIVQGIRWRHLA